MTTLTAPLNSLEKSELETPELGTLSPAMQTLYAPVAAELAQVEAIFRREMHHLKVKLHHATV